MIYPFLSPLFIYVVCYVFYHGVHENATTFTKNVTQEIPARFSIVHKFCRTQHVFIAIAISFGFLAKYGNPLLLFLVKYGMLRQV